MIDKVLRYALLTEQFNLLNESEASDEAHKLGLTHSGWKYWKDKSGKTVAQTVKGKLVAYSGPEPTDKKDGSSGASGDLKGAHDDALQTLVDFAMQHSGLDLMYEMDVRKMVLDAVLGNEWDTSDLGEPADSDAEEQLEVLNSTLEMYKNSKHSKPINSIRAHYKQQADEKAQQDADALADKYNDPDAPEATQKFFADPQVQGSFNKLSDDILMQAAAYIPSDTIIQAMENAKYITKLVVSPDAVNWKSALQAVYNKLVAANGLGTMPADPVAPTNKFSDPDAPPSVQKFFADPKIQELCKDLSQDELMQVAALVPMVGTNDNITTTKLYTILKGHNQSNDYVASTIWDALEGGKQPNVAINKPAETPPTVQPVPLAKKNDFDPNEAYWMVASPKSKKEKELLMKYLEKLKTAKDTSVVFNVGQALKKHKLVDKEGWKKILKYHQATTDTPKYGAQKGEPSAIDSLPEAPADYVEPELQSFDAYTPEQKELGLAVFEDFLQATGTSLEHVVAPEHQKEVSERIMAALFADGKTAYNILAPLSDNNILDDKPYQQLFGAVDKIRTDIANNKMPANDNFMFNDQAVADSLHAVGVNVNQFDDEDWKTVIKATQSDWADAHTLLTHLLDTGKYDKADLNKILDLVKQNESKSSGEQASSIMKRIWGEDGFGGNNQMLMGAHWNIQKAIEAGNWSDAKSHLDNVFNDMGLDIYDDAQIIDNLTQMVQDKFQGEHEPEPYAPKEVPNATPSPQFQDYIDFAKSVYPDTEGENPFEDWGDQQYKQHVKNAFEAPDYTTAAAHIDKAVFGDNYKQKFKNALKKYFANKSTSSANNPNLSNSQVIAANNDMADEVLSSAGLEPVNFPTIMKQIIANALSQSDTHLSNAYLASMEKSLKPATFHKIAKAVENAHTIKQFPKGVTMQDVDDVASMAGIDPLDLNSSLKIKLAMLIHGLPHDIMVAKLIDFNQAGMSSYDISQALAKFKQKQSANTPKLSTVDDVNDVLSMSGIKPTQIPPGIKGALSAGLDNDLDWQQTQAINMKLQIAGIGPAAASIVWQNIEKFKKAKKQLGSDADDIDPEVLAIANNATDAFNDEYEDNTDMDDLEAEYPHAAHQLSNAGLSSSGLTSTQMQGIEDAFDAISYSQGLTILNSLGLDSDISTNLPTQLQAHFGEDAPDSSPGVFTDDDYDADSIASANDFLGQHGIGTELWSPEDKVALAQALNATDGTEAANFVLNTDGFKALTNPSKQADFVKSLIAKVEANIQKAAINHTPAIIDPEAFTQNIGLPYDTPYSLWSMQGKNALKLALAQNTFADAEKMISNHFTYSMVKAPLLNALMKHFEAKGASTPPAATSGMLPVPGEAPEVTDKEIPQSAQKAAATLMKKMGSTTGVEGAKKWVEKKLKEKQEQATDSAKGKEKQIKDIENLKHILLALDKYHGGSHLAGLTPQTKTQLDNVSYDLLTNHGHPLESDDAKQAVVLALGATNYDEVVAAIDGHLKGSAYAKNNNFNLDDLKKAVADELGFTPTEKAPEAAKPKFDYANAFNDVGLNIHPDEVTAEIITGYADKFFAEPDDTKAALILAKMAGNFPGLDTNKLYALAAELKNFKDATATPAPVVLSASDLIKQAGIKVPVDALPWLDKYMNMAVNAKTTDELVQAFQSLQGIGNINAAMLIALKDKIVAANPHLQKIDVSKLTPQQAHEQNAIQTFFNKFPMQHKTTEERKKVESLIKAAANTKAYQEMKAVLTKGLADGIIGQQEFEALKGTSGIMAMSYNKIQAELTAAQQAEQLKQQAMAQEDAAKKAFASLPEKSKKLIQSAVVTLDKETNGAYSKLPQAHKNLVNKAVLDSLAVNDTIGVEKAFQQVAQQTGLPAAAVNKMKSATIDSILGIVPYTPAHEPTPSTPVYDRVKSVIAKWTDDTGFGKGQMPHGERTALEAVVEKALQVPPNEVNSTISALYTSTSLLDSQIEDMRARIQQERMKPSSGYQEPQKNKFGVATPATLTTPWGTPTAPYGLTPKGKPKKAPKALDSIGKKMNVLGIDPTKYPELKKKISDIINSNVQEKQAGAYGAEDTAAWKTNQMLMNSGIPHDARKKLKAFVKANVKKGNVFDFDGNLDMGNKLAKQAGGAPSNALPASLSNVADPYGLIQNEIIPGETVQTGDSFHIKGGTQTPHGLKEALGQESEKWRKQNLSPQLQKDFNEARSGWQGSAQWYKAPMVRRFMNRTYTKICNGPPPLHETMGGELRRGLSMSASDFIEFAKAFKVGSKVYLGPSGFSANFGTASNFMGSDQVNIILRAVPNKTGKIKACRLYGQGHYDGEAEIVLGTGKNMNVLNVVKHIYGIGKNKQIGYEIVMMPDDAIVSEAFGATDPGDKFGLETRHWKEAGLSARTQALMIKYLNSSVHTKY